MIYHIFARSAIIRHIDAVYFDTYNKHIGFHYAKYHINLQYNFCSNNNFTHFWSTHMMLLELVCSISSVPPFSRRLIFIARREVIVILIGAYYN